MRLLACSREGLDVAFFVWYGTDCPLLALSLTLSHSLAMAASDFSDASARSSRSWSFVSCLLASALQGIFRGAACCSHQKRCLSPECVKTESSSRSPPISLSFFSRIISFSNSSFSSYIDQSLTALKNILTIAPLSVEYSSTESS
jgi:hypothetical protein